MIPVTPSFRLDNQRALVTGGSRGIGFAAALALADAGARVWIAARDNDRLASAVQQAASVGLTLYALPLDVCDTAAVRQTLANLSSFHILVNSAGLARHQPFAEVSEANFDAVMAVNLRATFFLSQQVAAGMRAAQHGGSIIHLSSQMAHVAGPQRSVYCASKAALEGLTRAMALELGRERIRVNTLCPTFIETELSQASLADDAFRQEALRRIQPGRLGTLEDVMGPIVFLASAAAALITGSALKVDGGWTVY